MQNRFRISIRGPAIWNNFVANTEKELESTITRKTFETNSSFHVK